jgi:ATP:ADP antiporter, AAA family
MSTHSKGIMREWFGLDTHEAWKVGCLAAIFFLVIGAYTVTRELKSAIFMTVVGREYVPLAKILGMLILIPLILYYSRLVDTIHRYQLLLVCSTAFGIVSLLCTLLIGDPSIGISNTQGNPWRFFGWLFFFFIEAYSPFVVSVFWAFANSVNNPESAKRHYGFVVCGSKIGGMLSAGLAWFLFGMGREYGLSDVFSHQIIMAASSVMILCIPPVVWLLMKKVPAHLLHGYEAAHKIEEEPKHKHHSKPGVWSGLIMFFKYPYVLGIFGMGFFYEVASTVLGYLRLGIAEANAQCVSDVSKVLFEIAFKTHAVGFIISFFGTRFLHEKLGTRLCLLLVPLLMGSFLFYLIIAPTTDTLVYAFVAFKAVHYAFSWPVRESLYIPTVKEIQFKTKSWIDAFGSKFARATGSAVNEMATVSGSTFLLPLHSFFFVGLTVLWFITAWLLGHRFDRAINRGEVIGADDNESGKKPAQ